MSPVGGSHFGAHCEGKRGAEQETGARESAGRCRHFGAPARSILGCSVVSGDLAAIVVCAAVTAALAALGKPIVAGLPEPVLASDAADKIPYAELAAQPRLAVILAGCGAVAGAVVGGSLGFAAITPAWVYLAAVGVILAYVDSRTRLLPTRLIAPSYGVLVLLITFAYVVERDTHVFVRSAWGWLVMGGFYFVMWFIYPKGLGYGDVRLAGLLGLTLGYLSWGALVTGMYAGFLLGGFGGGLLAALKIADRKHFPFGPFMLIGSLVGLVWGQPLAEWYTTR